MSGRNQIMDIDCEMDNQINDSTVPETGLTPEMQRIMVKDCSENLKAQLEYEDFCKKLQTKLISIGLQNRIQHIFKDTAANMESAELLKSFFPSCKYYFVHFVKLQHI